MDLRQFNIFKNCEIDSENNPYGNYINNSDNPKRSKVCKINEDGLEDKFYQKTNFSPASVKVSDSFKRYFYTNPVTTSSNNQSEFANYLYGNTSICRDTGYLCKINQSKGSKERIVVESENYLVDNFKPNYMDISNKY